ncbi:FAD:protein FMN transferase [Candidatus Thioglobus sp.]|nr:FAD:protein FMN transferase [Candidatus Thioglobus sp.]
MRKYCLILILFLLSGCFENESVEQIKGESMGTSYSINVLGDESIEQDIIDRRLVEINNTFSTWQDDSELSQLNRAPVDEWIDVSSELYSMLKQSEEIYKQTDGYFDPGIGRLIDLWGFGASGGRTEEPKREAIEKAFKNSSIRYLLMEDGRVKKTRDIHINLSAIAKGYAVDEVARLIKTSGIKNFLVEIGGEIVASGNNRGDDWVVGVERPDNKAPIPIALKDASIATSGNYRNYFIWEGKKYMHIFNPSTGLPANNDLFSATVIHPQSAMSDAYATAMMAMGSVKAIELANKLKLTALLITIKEDNNQIIKINLP